MSYHGIPFVSSRARPRHGPRLPSRIREYIEPHTSICNDVDELLGDAPRTLPVEGDHHPVALLRASDWMTISLLALAPDPLLMFFFPLCLQRGYNDLTPPLPSACVWQPGLFQFMKPARMTPSNPLFESNARHYLALYRAIPPRLRQLHVDLVFGRVFFS
jgi:hypothetical protein